MHLFTDLQCLKQHLKHVFLLPSSDVHRQSSKLTNLGVKRTFSLVSVFLPLVDIIWTPILNAQFIWESWYPIKAAIKRTLMKHEFRYFLLLKCFFKNVGCECNSIVAQNQETSALSGQIGLVYRNMKLTFSLALFRRKFLLFQSNLRSLLKEGKNLRQAFRKYSRRFHYG